MSAGMAEVIAAHSGHSVKLSPQGRFTVQCHGCGESTSVSRVTPPRSGSPIQAAHVAEELAKAGYGSVQGAKTEAVREAAIDWAAYQSARMPRSDVLQVPVWLNQRAATMEGHHGVD